MDWIFGKKQKILLSRDFWALTPKLQLLRKIQFFQLFSFKTSQHRAQFLANPMGPFWEEKFIHLIIHLMTDWPTKGRRKKVGIHKSNKTLRSSMYKSTSCRELLLRFSFWIYQYSIGLLQWIYYPDLTFLETILLTSFLIFQDKGNKYWAMKKYSLNFYKWFFKPFW